MDGICNHKWQPVTFSLVVADFGVEYIGKQHEDHLIQSIRKCYSMDIDCTRGI